MDHNTIAVRNAVSSKDRTHPLAKQWLVSLSKCTVDRANPLWFRYCLVVPAFDLLRLRLLEDYHALPPVQHPGIVMMYEL
jgi:hypothetical protein